MSFPDWLLRVIALALRFEADIRRARYKQYIHRHRIFLEIVKNTESTNFGINFLNYKPLECDDGHREQFLQSIV